MRSECLSCDCTFSGGCRAEQAPKPVEIHQIRNPVPSKPPPGFEGIWINAKGHKIRYPRPTRTPGTGWCQMMKKVMEDAKQKYVIRILAGHDCWVADSKGDPGRTLVRANAKEFRSKSAAIREMNKLARLYPNRVYSVEESSL